MGAWGTITSPFKGRPKPPKARKYSGDTYWREGGAGTERARGADEAGYGLLQRYLARDPGYTAEEKQAMYDIPAEQLKSQETSAIAATTQGAAGASGRFGGGGKGGGRGKILTEGLKTRAGLKQNIIVQAANVAMEDRIRQIQAAQDYSTRGFGFRANENQGLNAYNMGLNALDQTNYQTELTQYNYDREKTREFVRKIMASFGGGGGGGQGMGMGGGGGGG